MLVEFLLALGQLGMAGRGLLLHRRDHGLHALDQLRHQRGLALQQFEGLLALVRLRIRPQGGGDFRIQARAGLQPLAPAQRRQQAKHGRSGHAGDRGAEGEAQAFHRRGQRGAHGVQVGGAFQRQAGAAQGRHHAQQGTEHAQQHQQADQVGRQRRRRQWQAAAFHAQAHRRAQARMQPFQPAGQAVRQRIGQGLQGVTQARGGLAVAPQLQRTGQVAGGD